MSQQYDSKQAEKRGLDEAYADELIKILPEALQNKALKVLRNSPRYS